MSRIVAVCESPIGSSVSLRAKLLAGRNEIHKRQLAAGWQRRAVLESQAMSGNEIELKLTAEQIAKALKADAALRDEVHRLLSTPGETVAAAESASRVNLANALRGGRKKSAW
jgi:hypothetical protein